MTENWLPVQDFPRYEVSDLGRVRTVRTGHIHQGHICVSGYLTVSLTRKIGRSVSRFTHRVVAEAFLGEAQGMEVKHKNGDKIDNRLSNLELAPRIKPIFTDHLLTNYTPVPETGCWLWLVGWKRDKYGKVNKGGRAITEAHRMFYQHFNGEIPSGLYVCHKCDTPSCCNPSHLFLGTHADNMADMVRKGRSRQGRKEKAA